MKQPFISIIIPVYNAEDSIKTMVSSILSENIDGLELILVDDGSTDSTLNVLRGIKSNRKDVVVISQKNGGPSAARNAGLKKARGEYIQFYDADDKLAPGGLREIIKSAKSTKADILVSGWAVDLEKDGHIINRYKKISPEKETVLGDNIIEYTTRSIGVHGKLYNLWNKLFKADIIKKNNLSFNKELRFGEDLVFSLDCLKHAQKLVFIPKITYYYKSSSNSGVFSKSSLLPEYRRANNKALEDFVGHSRSDELDDLFNWVKWRWLLSYWKFVAASSLDRKEKLKRIKELANDDYKLAKSPKFIGTKRFAMSHIANILRRSPYMALVAMNISLLLMKTVINVKSSFKS